ncbi:probable neuroblastoma-amplified sequence at N-terminal half [Coccomyxa sp. Obi]|nr:probable neuroblastoma-amplified sequence at N-terminal half [Coccomyxa sp. Obi]
MYFRRRIIYAENIDDTDSSSARPCPGNLALSSNNEYVAVIPQHGNACRILRQSAAGCLEVHPVFKPDEQSTFRAAFRLGTWNAIGSTLAVASDAGHILLVDRDGKQQAVIKHSRWRQSLIIGLFFSSNDVVSVLCDDASLWAVNVQDTSIHEVLSDRANMGTPSCSDYDAQNGILCIAGRGAVAEGEPCVSLWQMGSGVRPTLLARYGRPARKPWMRAVKREREPWGQAAVLGENGTLTVVDIASLEPRLQVPDCSANAILASAGPRADTDPGDLARVFLLSERRGDPGADNSRSWQIEALSEKSAEEELEELIGAQDWPAALALAREHSLSADPVHKARFLSRQVGRESISEDLESLQDRSWAAEQGTSCLASTSTAQAEVLEYSLAESDRWGRLPEQDRSGGEPSTSYEEISTPPYPSGHPWWWRQRLLLLQQNDRLQTYLDLHGGAFDPAAFADFRDCTLKEAAMAFASSGSAAALRKLLQRHAYALMPHLLDILSCFPETLPPKAHVESSWLLCALQAARDGKLEPPQIAREPDWVESAETCQQLQESGDYGMLIATEHMARLFLGWRPPTAHQVGQWFGQRALQVDTRCGQLSCAGAVLQLSGRADAPQTVRDMQEAVHSLRDIVQSGELLKSPVLSTSHSPNGCLLILEMPHKGNRNDDMHFGESGTDDSWAIGLDAWASLDMAQRMRLLAAGDQPMEHQYAQLAKLLGRVPAVQRQQMLLDLLGQLAPLRLQWCADFLRLEAQHAQVFEGSRTMAQAACLVAYACPEDADWDVVQGMLKAAGSGTEATAHGQAAEGWDGWQDAEEDVEADSRKKEDLEKALSLVGATKLLKDLGVPMTLADLRDCDATAQSRIIHTLLARLSRSQPPLTDQRWTEVWRQLRELWQSAFSELSPENLLADFCTALLRCARWRLAQKYLAGTASVALDPGRAETLVLDCAKEYFFSATSLQSPEVAQAQACLDVLPHSVAAAAERSFIKGVLRLHDFGVETPPLQCCQVEDRMELLQMALDARPGAHSDGGRLALLAELLGVAERHSELQLRRARAALRDGDISAAREHAAELAAQGYVPAWEVVAELQLKGTQDHGEEMLTLLAFCLAHCPGDQVHAHLDKWKRSRRRVASAMSLEDVKALLHKTVRSRGSADTSILPDVGDAALALSCMLALGSSTGFDDEALMRGLSFAASRSVLLLQMFASSLQALSPESLPLDDMGAAVSAAQERLQLSPWDACSRSADLDPGQLSKRARTARQCSLEVRSRLTAAADERALRSLLPPSAVPLFAARVSSDVSDLRQYALLEVVTSTAREGPVARARQRLQQALMLADRYKLSTWHLQMGYAGILLLDASPDEDVREAIEAVKGDLLKEPRALMSALAAGIWANAAPGATAKLMLLLSLLEDCLNALGGSETHANLLAVGKEFLQRCARVAPALHAKLFLAPLLAAAIGGIDPSLSPHLISAAVNASSTGGWLGESAAAEAPQGRPKGLEKLPLKRMLFAADGSGEDGSQLLQRWQKCALDEICEHVTPSNAAKLAALIRSLPDLVALLRQALPAQPPQQDITGWPGMGHSTVLLAVLCKEMSAQDRESAEEGSSDAPTDLSQTYKASRKHVRQLEARHLVAFLRFLVLRGQPPLPSCQAPAPLPAPLRLQVVQDGIALLEANLASAQKDTPSDARHPSQMDLEEVRALLGELQREAGALSMLTHLRERAGLSEAQLHLLQRSLGQRTAHSDSAPSNAGGQTGLPRALTDLVLAGCDASKLQRVACTVLHEAGNAAAGAGTEGAAPWQESARLVREAVTGVVEDGLGSLRHAAGYERAPAKAVAALETAVGCLDQPVDPDVMHGPGAAAEWMQGMRREVWQRLLGFILDAEQADSAHSAPVCSLVDSIAPDAAHPSRWQGWQPEGDSAQLRPLLLLCRTLTLLGENFWTTSVRSSDVAGLAAAKAFFLRFVRSAQTQQQMLILLELLDDVWDSGAAFTAAGQAEAAPQHEGGTALGNAGDNGDTHANASSRIEPHERDESDSNATKAAWQDSSAPGSVAPDDDEGWEGADELDIALEQSSKADDPAPAHSSRVSTGEASAVTKDSGREAEEPLEAEPETSSQASLPRSGKEDNCSQDGTARSGQVVPLHECWAALLLRMLGHGSPWLKATVLRTIEDAAARKPFLLSLAEAHALTEAAGDMTHNYPAENVDVAVTLGLLMPYMEVQRAAEARMRSSPHALEPPDDSLIAVLLSRRLWPSLTQTSAYPRLSQALVRHPPNLTGGRDTGGGSADEGQAGPAAAAALAPSAAAALAESGDHAGAAAIAAAHLGIHPAMSTLGGGLSVLGPYLRGAARAVEAAAVAAAADDDAAVPGAIEYVWGMLSGQCERALSRSRQDRPEC